MKHPGVDKIAFTGEGRTGQLIMKNAAETLKRITFELGGKSPNIVFADADLDAAVDGRDARHVPEPGPVLLRGQPAVRAGHGLRRSSSRSSPPRSKARKLGDPFDPATEQGPQVDKAQFDKILVVHRQGQGAGGPVRHRRRAARRQGLLHQADDLRRRQGRHGDRPRRDLRAGPVGASSSRTSRRSIERANTTDYGLAAAVWTRDIGKAHAIADRVRAGTVWVNCYDVFDAAAPFGGFKRSGIGRELGEKALDNYTELKTVTIALD